VVVDDLVTAFGTVGAGIGRPAEIAETHVSVVIFVGDRAYKLKKPVRTAFLDYSTRAAREAVCHQEVALNRRLAPDVYLGVVDLLGPDRQPVDHLVAMRRMPGDRRLSTLVEEGRATAALLVPVARTMAAFHARARRGPHIDEAASPQAVRRLWTNNLAEMMEFSGSVLDPDLLGVVEAMALTYLDGRDHLLEERIERGRIVDGQGDLLASDIFCLDDGPRILDCLEFDETLRFGDVLLDVGFLAMDLDRLGRPDLARLFLDAYREFSAETHPRSLEHHYVAYRALVRAKVACLVAAGGRPAAQDDARLLMELCARHLYHGRVHLVLVGGAPGTGKTTVADRIGERLGWTVLRSDEVRKEEAGLDSLDRATAPFEHGIYSAASTAATYAELLRRAEIAVARGESVVLDATWSSAAHRAEARRIARSSSAELTELRCACPAALAAARLTARLGGGGDASDADAEVASRIRGRFDPWPEGRPIDTARDRAASLHDALRHLGGVALLPDGFEPQATSR
jgi:aminoglycoside phosphotransferase family enzyme/predicted kinase